MVNKLNKFDGKGVVVIKYTENYATDVHQVLADNAQILVLAGSLQWL